jgi:hypothetical protein
MTEGKEKGRKKPVIVLIVPIKLKRKGNKDCF